MIIVATVVDRTTSLFTGGLLDRLDRITVQYFNYLFTGWYFPRSHGCVDEHLSLGNLLLGEWIESLSHFGCNGIWAMGQLKLLFSCSLRKSSLP
eukprot:5360205-Amphidinium_carterae.1